MGLKFGFGCMVAISYKMINFNTIEIWKQVFTSLHRVTNEIIPHVGTVKVQVPDVRHCRKGSPVREAPCRQVKLAPVLQPSVHNTELPPSTGARVLHSTVIG